MEMTPFAPHLRGRARGSGASAPAAAHLEAFAKQFAERFSAMVERKIFTVFGNPSAELKAVLDKFNPIYLKPFGDFDYWA